MQEDSRRSKLESEFSSLLEDLRDTISADPALPALLRKHPVPTADQYAEESGLEEEDLWNVETQPSAFYTLLRMDEIREELSKLA